MGLLRSLRRFPTTSCCQRHAGSARPSAPVAMLFSGVDTLTLFSLAAMVGRHSFLQCSEGIASGCLKL